ncbi:MULTISPECIES: hypothetical protein [Streptosporangium]|uniref:Integrase n=1 Tax=Streptosporangium brasiliense TaxID=47480 RepID=A0ABT9RG66_9ACTN|nr:hypothetical protein [Streptosporangium brasiliense]MDP9868272.1 integrase [Streptosporangium brasiliense]
MSEDHLTHYRDGIGTGSARAGLARPGVALTPATVAHRLSSLYGYALRRRLTAVNPVNLADPVERPEVSIVGTTPARTVEEATALVDGAETISAAYPADAAAVALLSVCAMCVGELVALTVSSVAADAGHHTVILFRRKVDRMPIPPRVRALLQPLLDDRSPSESLFVQADG